MPGREIAPLPLFQLALPDLLEADNGRGREPGRLRPQQRGKGLGEIARGDALQIKPGQELLDRLGAPEIGGRIREVKRICDPVSPAPRLRTLGQRTETGPMPVWISRSGKYPWRTIRRRPASSTRSACPSTKDDTSISTACARRRRAPRRKISVSESSENVPDWRSWTTVSSLMAYPSFVENGDSIIARIRRPHLNTNFRV